MALSKRSLEVKAVTAMLTSDEYESAEDMALAIVKHVQASALDKKSFALGNRHLGFDFVWGPYVTENEAKRDLVHLTGGEAIIFPLLSVTDLRSRLVTDFDPVKACANCRHPEVAHWNGRTCASNRCKCEEYVA